jgi:NAD(P) transhydrogenase
MLAPVSLSFMSGAHNRRSSEAHLLIALSNHHENQCPITISLFSVPARPARGRGAGAYYGKRVAIVERAPYVGSAAINTGTVLPNAREVSLALPRGCASAACRDRLLAARGADSQGLAHRERVVVEQRRETIRQNLERHAIKSPGTGDRRPHTVRVHTDTGETRDPCRVHPDRYRLIPYHPPAVPFDSVRVYDSDSILQMPFIPQTMAVVGGGVIGSEYASVFTALGVQVTLIEARDRLLPAIDHEIARRLQAQLEPLGLRFVFGDQVTSV